MTQQPTPDLTTPDKVTSADRLRTLLEELEASDPAVVRPWRQAWLAAPRDRFVPDLIWTPYEWGPGLRALDRNANEADAAWWDHLVYSDRLVITQVDDGRAHTPGAIGLRSSSSVSEPSYVLRFLHALNVAEGMRVLEIGTGSGWNAALLAARLGATRITTVELDPDLAHEARSALHSVGLGGVTVATADGTDGWPTGAPYDRLVATCSVHRIPPAWLAQTRPGGIIVAPWRTHGDLNGGLVQLTVAADGTAHGPFVGDAPFMWLRAQRPPTADADDLADHQDQADTTTTELDPRAITDDPLAAFLTGARVPGLRWTRYNARDDSGEATVWLTDDTGSWASIDYDPTATSYEVAQHGPRRLWNETEDAYHWWDSENRPSITAFGLAITSSGDIRLWYRHPDGPSWPIIT